MFSTKEAFSLASPQVGAEGGGRGEVGKVEEGERGREGGKGACDGDGERKSRAEKTSERASEGSEATSSLFRIGFLVGHDPRVFKLFALFIF